MFSKDFGFELYTTYKFSDFRFTISSEKDFSVHRVLLSAKSPIFKWYFETRKGKKADLLDLVVCEGIMGYDDNDEDNKKALRDALIDIIGFCYVGDCSNCRRDTSKYFKIRVVSLLLTHALADRFEIPDLITLVEKKFENAFAWFCTNAADEHVDSALKICFSRATLNERHIRGRTLELLRDTAMWMFEQQVENYKRAGKGTKAADLRAQIYAELHVQGVVTCDVETKVEAKKDVKKETQE